MELNEYQGKAMTTCMESSDNYVYMSEGLDGEVGEFKGKIAKLIRKKKIRIDDNRIVWDNCREELGEIIDDLESELGDILWFVSGLAVQLGLDLEEVAQRNLEKLASRKQRGVIDGCGDNR